MWLTFCFRWSFLGLAFFILDCMGHWLLTVVVTEAYHGQDIETRLDIWVSCLSCLIMFKHAGSFSASSGNCFQGSKHSAWSSDGRLKCYSQVSQNILTSFCCNSSFKFVSATEKFLIQILFLCYVVGLEFVDLLLHRWLLIWIFLLNNCSWFNFSIFLFYLTPSLLLSINSR